MKVIVFDVKSSVGHFRRPDTTATQLTYPFMPPTAAKGLVGAILGISDFTTNDKVGIELRSKVRLVSQQLSLLHNGGSTFNRPTTIQLLVEPAYRIYYCGDEYANQLETFLKNNHSVYTTYLGSAFALTTPKYVGTWEFQEIRHSDKIYPSLTAVPVSAVKELIFDEERTYQRASGFMKYYKGNREFEKSVDFLYEPNGKKILLKPNTDVSGFTLLENDGELICLV